MVRENPNGTRTPLTMPIWGGRAHMRTVLDMGTRVATRDNPRITACDARLLTAGTGHKVALTAWRQQCLILRNARMKQRTPGQVPAVQGSKTYEAP